MNAIARAKVEARQTAGALADSDLAPRHSHHILQVEAILRETADRLDRRKNPGDAELALEFVAELHLIQASHARLTALARRAGAEFSVMSGER